MSLPERKTRLRNEFRRRREALAAAMPDHARRLAAHAAALALPPDAVVAGYNALPGEADPAILLETLRRRGHAIALPRVAAKAAPLIFHAFEAGAALIPGAYGVREPSGDAPALVPDIVLVPLLAFDAAGHRLGYGGGYYDRTLAQLRGRRTVAVIGIAFAGQEAGLLPAGPFDQRLDTVLTERGLRRFAGS